MDKKRLTAENGKPIADNQNIQTAGVRDPADAERDIRGFAMKFYTDTGTRQQYFSVNR